MLNNSKTINLMDEQLSWEPTSSGEWLEECEYERVVPSRILQYAKTTVAALFLLTSPASNTNVERWFRKRENSSTILSIMAPSFRRRITLKEARIIALKVMYEVENRRDSFAEAEGKRMAIWEEP